MSNAEVALVVIGVLAVVGVALWRGAQRLDRLHQRVIRSRATLDAQLVHRAEAAVELAESGLLDPASSVIVADAAWRAAVHAERLVGEEDESRHTTGSERGLVESELTHALRAALGEEEDQEALAADPRGGELLERLRHHTYRVQLARRFHNDAVTQIGHIRGTWLVRTFHLAGRAAMPQTFEMDDAVMILSPVTRP
ncbi:MAG: hypothetical protein JJE50_05445 [Actinomycetales bacterium]|nr:hypothetical protein [Actinomycetales bacterium]